MKMKFKLFSIRGGVHPDDRKRLSADLPIERPPLAPLLHIPLQQHIGAAAEPLVARGSLVKKGQLLAKAQGMISAPVHAPTSGQIMSIGSYPAHHPSGINVRTITLKPDGKDEWDEGIQGEADPLALDAAQIIRKVAQAGIVGMGGATFPSAVKLDLRKRYELHTLVINGAECEPYLTCDDRLMRESPELVVKGSLLMAKALGVSSVLIAVENNKPEAQTALRSAAAEFPQVQVIGLPTRYPMGSEKHLVQTLIGKETPARGLTADIGVVVHNSATAVAVYEAIAYGWPLLERVITLSGGAIRYPRNLRAPLGTPLSHLVDYCGGFRQPPARLISGGPMMGQPLPGLKAPLVKGSNGLLALTEEEIAGTDEMPCIRCASCVSACPCGLVPLQMAAQIRSGSLDASVNLGLLDCIACGSCSYVCPAHIPLVQYFNYAKGELASRQRARHKQLETKRLAEARTERIAAQQRARAEALARQKKEKEAAQQQQQQAEAQTAMAGD